MRNEGIITDFIGVKKSVFDHLVSEISSEIINDEGKLLFTTSISLGFQLQ